VWWCASFQLHVHTEFYTDTYKGHVATNLVGPMLIRECLNFFLEK